MNKIIIVFILLISTTTFSQIKISGVVKDTKGEALIGVNIAVKGSYDGATSNAKGEYNFETDAKDSLVLSATYIGFLPQEKGIKITGNAMSVNFLLKQVTAICFKVFLMSWICCSVSGNSSFFCF